MIRNIAIAHTVVSLALIGLSAPASAHEAQKTAVASTPASADPMASCPMHAQHMAEAAAAKSDPSHAHEVDSRHDTFGMSHDATTHHFRLFQDGGAIELRANNASDKETIEAIRTHLQEVAAEFTKNDFATPKFVHGKSPDGVTEMARLHGAIDYRYEPVENGGRIRIVTRSGEARTAVHDFLKFQVAEHRTADSGNLESER